MLSDMISQRSGGSRSASGVQLGTGRGTLRLRSKGPATVQELVSKKRPSALAFFHVGKVLDFVPCSPRRLRKRPSRRWTTCWKATWASETASSVRPPLAFFRTHLCHCRVFCARLNSALTPLGVRSGDHGGTGKGQEEPR